MKIRILSDLHIEFHPFEIPELPDDASTVLVLAGDIGMICRPAELEALLRNAAARFLAVCYVLGNHEMYNEQWPHAITKLRQLNLPNNVHILERQTIEIENVVFVGATLWTDYGGRNPKVMRDAELAMNDYHKIYMKRTGDLYKPFLRITAERILSHHMEVRAWLKKTLRKLHEEGRKTVLITHHGITPQSIHEKYKGDFLNGAFVSDLSRMILNTRPALAIHGHVHQKFDYYVGGTEGTRVVVNPRGYPRQNDGIENSDFDPLLTVEI